MEEPRVARPAPVAAAGRPVGDGDGESHGARSPRGADRPPAAVGRSAASTPFAPQPRPVLTSLESVLARPLLGADAPVPGSLAASRPSIAPPRGPAALYAPLGGGASNGYRPPLSFGLM